MAISVWLKIDEERVVQELQEAGETLDSAGGEVVLDFSSVHRIDSSALWALQCVADEADRKSVKLILSGVSVAVYKVLKLAKLASRFSFSN